MDRRQAAFVRGILAAAFMLANCSVVQAQPQDPPSPKSAATTTPVISFMPGPSKNPEAQAIEAAKFAQGMDAVAQHRFLVKLETLLDRAHFSPGEIDGQSGSNLNNSIAAYKQAHHVPDGGKSDGALFDALTKADPAPVTADYVITEEDAKGPFLGTIPTDMAKMAKLEHLGYANPLEGLAEKFHMSEALLRELNPQADFRKIGTSIVVLRSGDGDIGGTVARVEVDKSIDQVRGLDSAGHILAAFPATVGSTERPAPSGEWAVKSVAFNPPYTYDPKRLTFGKKSRGVLKIAPGPNNPVGTTWIDLTAETYGIHGSPEPNLIGKTASHGCVRLTNWDAAALGHAVKKGTPVVFVGQTTKG